MTVRSRAHLLACLGVVVLSSAAEGQSRGEVRALAHAPMARASIESRQPSGSSSRVTPYLIRGALIGGGIGYVAGYVGRAAYDGDVQCLDPTICESKEGPSGATTYVVLPLAGAALGGLLGWAIGARPWAPSISTDGPTTFAWSVQVNW